MNPFRSMTLMVLMFFVQICISSGYAFSKERDNPLVRRDRPFAIHFLTKDIGWVVGDRGLVFKTADGGESWQSLKMNSRYSFKDITFIDGYGWIVGEEGVEGLIHYWKPFEAYAVERAIAEFENCVVDFGAGHSVYEEQGLFSRVEKALKPVKNVIQILPSPDLDRSVEIVNQRFSELMIREVGKIDPELLQLNEHFVRHPSNHLLAKKTIYNEDKKPAEIADEIINWIQGIDGADDSKEMPD